jgi:hypothetical protein
VTDFRYSRDVEMRAAVAVAMSDGSPAAMSDACSPRIHSFFIAVYQRWS